MHFMSYRSNKIVYESLKEIVKRVMFFFQSNAIWDKSKDETLFDVGPNLNMPFIFTY